MRENHGEQQKRTIQRVRRAALPDQVALTVPQAAVVMGKTERAVWLDIYRNRLTHRRLGKKVIILREELLVFLRSLPGCSLEQAVARVEEVGDVATAHR